MEVLKKPKSCAYQGRDWNSKKRGTIFSRDLGEEKGPKAGEDEEKKDSEL